MQCNHCGAIMPEGSVFCQSCGQKIGEAKGQQNSSIKEVHPAPQVVNQGNSRSLDQLNYLFRKSGSICKKPGGVLPDGISNMFVLITEGIRIIFMTFDGQMMTDAIMENLILQKFRFDASLILIVDSGKPRKYMSSEASAKLSRNAILIKREDDIANEIQNIPDTISEEKLLRRIMQMYGISQTDKNSYIVQAKGYNEISAIADSLKEKVKLLRKKNGNP